MLLKSKITPEKRKRVYTALGPIAGLTLVLSIFLGRTGNPELDFLAGLLLGLSIVGNLAYIIVVSQQLKINGGHHD